MYLENLFEQDHSQTLIDICRQGLLYDDRNAKIRYFVADFCKGSFLRPLVFMLQKVYIKSLIFSKDRLPTGKTKND